MTAISNLLLVISLLIFVVGLVLFFRYEYKHCSLLKKSKARHEKIKETFTVVNGRLTRVEERVDVLEDKVE